MTKELKKAIEDATMIEFVDSHEIVICHSDHLATQAKLLRVIELLVEQRDEYIAANWESEDDCKNEIAEVQMRNAELVKVLNEGEK